MLSNLIDIVWIFFQIIIGFTLIFPAISFGIYLLTKQKTSSQEIDTIAEEDYAILVTAYKDVSNIPNVVKSLLEVDYRNFIIYVIADNCSEMITKFNDERVVILYPAKILENQIKSHFYAIEHFKRNHSRLTIIDSDNLVDKNYLKELDKLFNKGYEAVQGVRSAKNFDTSYACLDAANEIYYFYYNRKILFGLGSSSMLSGSGMAFTVPLFKECMQPFNNSGAGFDKILQKEIIKKGYRIAFAEKAIVYDEKTSTPDQLVKQRARWNNTWFRYFGYSFFLMGQGIKHLSINQFLFGYVLSRLPIFLLIILSLIIMGINLFISIHVTIIWIILFIIFIGSFFLALYKSNTDKRIYKSLIYIPKFIFLQVLSLFKVRKANQFSIATEHTFNKELDKIN